MDEWPILSMIARGCAPWAELVISDYRSVSNSHLLGVAWGGVRTGWRSSLSCDLGCVGVPVAACVSDPADGGGWGDVEEPGDHGGRECAGELG